MNRKTSWLIAAVLILASCKSAPKSDNHKFVYWDAVFKPAENAAPSAKPTLAQLLVQLDAKVCRMHLQYDIDNQYDTESKLSYFVVFAWPEHMTWDQAEANVEDGGVEFYQTDGYPERFRTKEEVVNGALQLLDGEPNAHPRHRDAPSPPEPPLERSIHGPKHCGLMGPTVSTADKPPCGAMGAASTAPCTADSAHQVFGAGASTIVSTARRVGRSVAQAWATTAATIPCAAFVGAAAVTCAETQTHGTFPVPHATGKNPEPIWIAHPYWDQYPMPGFWQCPVGYVQVVVSSDGSDVSVMSASKQGEMSGGSEDQSHKPECRLPKPGEF